MINVSLLTTVSQCDAVLDEKLQKKNRLVIDKNQIENAAANVANIAEDTPTELSYYEGEMVRLDAKIATLPDGPEKKALMIERNLAENKKFRIENREESSDPMAAFEKSVELEFLITEITTYEAIITQVETHKATLGTSGN